MSVDSKTHDTAQALVQKWRDRADEIRTFGTTQGRKYQSECESGINYLRICAAELEAALRQLPAGEVVAWWKRNSDGLRIALTDDERKRQPAWVQKQWEGANPLYTAPTAGAVPEGFVLVPREPTVEMLEAMGVARKDRANSEYCGPFPIDRVAYIASLAAAPKPQQDDGIEQAAVQGYFP